MNGVYYMRLRMRMFLYMIALVYAMTTATASPQSVVDILSSLPFISPFLPSTNFSTPVVNGTIVPTPTKPMNRPVSNPNPSTRINPPTSKPHIRTPKPTSPAPISPLPVKSNASVISMPNSDQPKNSRTTLRPEGKLPSNTRGIATYINKISPNSSYDGSRDKDHEINYDEVITASPAPIDWAISRPIIDDPPAVSQRITLNSTSDDPHEKDEQRVPMSEYQKASSISSVRGNLNLLIVIGTLASLAVVGGVVLLHQRRKQDNTEGWRESPQLN